MAEDEVWGAVWTAQTDTDAARTGEIIVPRGGIGVVLLAGSLLLVADRGGRGLALRPVAVLPVVVP